MKEVNNLLNRLGELDDAPLIWVNKKVYDMAEEIERLNNDIKELLKENSNKEKVIKIQDNIINKANEYIKVCKSNDMGIRYQRIEEILQGSDKE